MSSLLQGHPGLSHQHPCLCSTQGSCTDDAPSLHPCTGWPVYIYPVTSRLKQTAVIRCTPNACQDFLQQHTLTSMLPHLPQSAGPAVQPPLGPAVAADAAAQMVWQWEAGTCPHHLHTTLPQGSGSVKGSGRDYARCPILSRQCVLQQAPKCIAQIAESVLQHAMTVSEMLWPNSCSMCAVLSESRGSPSGCSSAMQPPSNPAACAGSNHSPVWYCCA